MDLRGFIDELEKDGKLIRIKEEVDPYLEVAGIQAKRDGETLFFEQVKGSDYQVVTGVCGSRDNFAKALGCRKEKLIPRIAKAIEAKKEPKAVKSGACQEIVEKKIDLSTIPILTHATVDLGPYIASGVYVCNDSELGYNLSYHRASPFEKNKLVARICHRDLYKYMKNAGGTLDISICLGLHPAIMLAASVSSGTETNEYCIANDMHPLTVVKGVTNNLLVPADAELVLEGTITTDELHEEGPFPDISATPDKVRQEPVITVNCITHRKNPIYQGLLPAAREHRLLMGMPKEPTIYKKVNEVATCKNVSLTTGGCSWLHAIVQIEKKNADDGKKAAEAAFEGHKSLKNCVVVDDDIDIEDINDVEWAIATRAQLDKDAKIWRGPGSSLDCTAEKMEGSDRLMTCKVALDATIPWDKGDIKSFKKVKLGE
ncbi:MAG: UbiD family decarboxylase [Candidatus Altiarchaeota archaeon]